MLHNKMEKAELLFIPCPGVGHLVSAVEMGKLLINQDEHLSVVFLIVQLSFDIGVDAYIESQLKDSSSRVRFVKIPHQRISSNQEPKSKIRAVVAFENINAHKPLVRDVVLEMILRPNSTKIAGIVVDMFCAGVIDVANEFDLPGYFSTLPVLLFLGFISISRVCMIITMKTLLITQMQMLNVPSFLNPVPANVLPTVMLDKNGGIKHHVYNS